MNASATIRNAYVRTSVMHMRPPSMQSTHTLQRRPVNHEKLQGFNKVDHLQHREDCEKERAVIATEKTYDSDGKDDRSFMEFDDEDTTLERMHKMLTIFPYRDPIYLVAVIFTVGSLDLVINALFDLLPRTIPESKFKGEETIAVPTTVLIGSIFFFLAGVFDVFAALNADRGTLETSKENLGAVTYKPALVGSPEFRWTPSRTKFVELATTNLAFQAGLVVTFGGVVFMFAGVVAFPGVVPEHTRFFKSIVFGPQIVHGFFFWSANLMLALSEQERWYLPTVGSSEWRGAFWNASGGFWFMVGGVLGVRGHDLGESAAELTGSLAFLVGSVGRWYVVMEFC